MPRETPRDPSAKQTPLLWAIIFAGCLMSGLSLAVMLMPPAGGAGVLAQFSFGLMLVLSLLLIGVAAWRLATVLTVARAAWRWVLLFASVAGIVAVGVWSTTSFSPDGSVLDRLGSVFSGGLGFAAALSAGMYALVPILSSRPEGSRAPQARSSR